MANRANHRVLLGYGLLCAAALLCAETVGPSAAEGPATGSTVPIAALPAAEAATGVNFPSASDARLAGDARQTRFMSSISTGASRFAPSRSPIPIG